MKNRLVHGIHCLSACIVCNPSIGFAMQQWHMEDTWQRSSSFDIVEFLLFFWFIISLRLWFFLHEFLDDYFSLSKKQQTILVIFFPCISGYMFSRFECGVLFVLAVSSLIISVYLFIFFIDE